MIRFLDSAYPPSSAAIAAALAADRHGWAGYFAGPNILNGWAWSDFQRVRAGGLATFAYVSGWSDPATMRAQSDAWGIPICLDVEGGIRGFGNWVQPWLDVAAPCGLYGNPPIHAGMRAAFHVCAAYPGYEPAVTWPAYILRPTVPCAWQWQGSHNEFGMTVDSTWADDSFASAYQSGGGTIGGDDLTPEEHGWLKEILAEIRGEFQFSIPDLMTGTKIDPAFTASLPNILHAVQSIQNTGGGLTPAQAQTLSSLDSSLQALCKHLGLGVA